jgi:parvulin-like peptidyl-prolyl isomerase
MSEAPQFRLPQRPAGRSSGNGIAVAILIIVLSILGVQVFTVLRPARMAASATSGTRWSADDLKAVAMKLEDRNLPTAAADTWSDYLAAAKLPAIEAAAIEFRIGKLRQNAHDYERALAALYRAEHLAGESDRKLSDQISNRLRECLQQMGRYGELTREMAAQTSLTPSSDSLTGGQVVAQIGDDKLTVADFDRLMHERVEALLASRPGMSVEQADAARKQFQAALADPQAKAQQLHEIIAARVLAEQAREEGLDQAPEYRQQLVLTAETLLASTLLNRRVRERAVVTPEDVERFFAANKARYVTPASARLAHIVCASKEQADEVLSRAKGGEPFDELAKSYSLDTATKDKGGVIETPLTESGDHVPGIGKDPALHAVLWQLDAGVIHEEPYQSAKGWEIIKVVEKQAAREPALPDVRNEVEADTRAARQQEVTQQYLQELLKTHNVQFFPNAFSAAFPATQPAGKVP